jgi:transposase
MSNDSLCPNCGQPSVLHLGYDHGRGVCLVDFSGLSVRLDGRIADPDEVIRRLREETEEEVTDEMRRLEAARRGVQFRATGMGAVRG